MASPAVPSPPSTAKAFFVQTFRKETVFTLFYRDADLLALGGETAPDWFYSYCCEQMARDKSKKPRYTSFEFLETVAKSKRVCRSAGVATGLVGP